MFYVMNISLHRQKYCQYYIKAVVCVLGYEYISTEIEVLSVLYKGCGVCSRLCIYLYREKYCQYYIKVVVCVLGYVSISTEIEVLSVLYQGCGVCSRL